MKILKFILRWGFFASIWTSILGVLILAYYFKGLPDLSDLKGQNGKQIVQINYANGNSITSRGEIYNSEISYYELPRHLVNAVVATEDRRFFKHIGVDVFGILRAFVANQKAGRVVQGGSTITQQLAKMLFLNPERTLKRKIQEVLLALQLERNFSKEQILTFYLSRAYFGSGNYGVDNAAKYYFAKNISKIGLNESAMLAGILKSPNKYSPKNNRDLAEGRAAVVIKGMVAAGFLDDTNIGQIDKEPSYKIDHLQKLYFADFVFNQFPEFLDAKSTNKKIIKITTTLDEKIQMSLEDVLDRFTYKNSKKIGKSQIAVIVMDKSGAVLGMSGGKDYQKSQFNRAVYSKRQAGSAFKTFVYLAAFEKGISPGDIYEDAKINIGSWVPNNYNDRYFGEVTVQQAFAKSLNSVAIQLGKEVGVGAVASIARKCGIVSKIDKDDLTIVLGTSEVSLLELTGSYATIANGGEPVIPRVILDMQDSNSNILYKSESSGFGSIISEESWQNINYVLRQSVEEGTGRNANVSQNIYGKTGTSQNFRDAWFVGFNNDYVVGVWMGNDNNSPTNKITGGSLPAKLFAEIIRKI